MWITRERNVGKEKPRRISVQNNWKGTTAMKDSALTSPYPAVRKLAAEERKIENDLETQLNEEAQRSEGWDWDWNLDNLIRIGFEDDEALGILSDYHSCVETRKNPEMGSWFRERRTYLYIHHQVILKWQFPTAPNKAIRLAAYYMAKSQDNPDEAMREIGLALGLNMMRYRVWDGDKNRYTYIEFLKRFKPFKGESKKSIKARSEIIERIEQETS